MCLSERATRRAHLSTVIVEKNAHDGSTELVN